MGSKLSTIQEENKDLQGAKGSLGMRINVRFSSTGTPDESKYDAAPWTHLMPPTSLLGSNVQPMPAVPETTITELTTVSNFYLLFWVSSSITLGGVQSVYAHCVFWFIAKV